MVQVESWQFCCCDPQHHSFLYLWPHCSQVYKLQKSVTPSEHWKWKDLSAMAKKNNPSFPQVFRSSTTKMHETQIRTQLPVHTSASPQLREFELWSTMATCESTAARCASPNKHQKSSVRTSQECAEPVSG